MNNAMDGQTLTELSKRVSRYFMEFLESDFKKQSTPRRKIALQTEAGFRSGLRIAPYPGLNTAVWAALEEPSGQPKIIRLLPGTFTRPMSLGLKAVIREQILILEPETVAATLSMHEEFVCSTRARALDNPEDWIEDVRGSLASLVGSQIVRPLLALLDGPISRQAYSPIDSIFSVEGEIVELLCTQTDRLLPDVLARYLASDDISELQIITQETFSLTSTRDLLLAYFESFATADAFLEFRDLDTYARTSEGKQLYLYLGSLKYAGAHFPLFFIPVDAERSERGYDLKISSHIYANKRAIDFVLQETASRQSRQWVSPISERITYLGQEQAATELVLPVMSRLLTAFGLGDLQEFGTTAPQVFSNTEVSITTDLFFAVYDSADEALINDYEEMLAQLQKQETGVIELFQGIVRDVILENPKPISDAVEGEWDSMPLVDRLVFDAPVPLNEEQIKVLKAVRMEEGKFILVEGPPGCGKSHTITAIAADCILNKKSCLVLSDKREALDVVQSKVSETMSRVRHDSDFPNPILRLGQQQTNFRKLISGQTLSKISAYAKSAKSNESKLLAEMKQKQNVLKSNISQTKELLGGLAIKDVERVFTLESWLGGVSPELCDELIVALPLESSALIGELLESADALGHYLREVHRSGAPFEGAKFLTKIALDSAVGLLSATDAPRGETLFRRLNVAQVRKLTGLLLKFEHLKMPIFGYLFRGSSVRLLETELVGELGARRPIDLKSESSILKKVVESSNRLLDVLQQSGLSEETFEDAFELLYGAKTVSTVAPKLDIVLRTMKAAGGEMPTAFWATRSPSDFAELWLKSLEFIGVWHRTTQTFQGSPQFDYLGLKSDLERLRTSRMNTEVDARLVAYMDNYKADARTLASLITQRQKFPANKFDQIKESFPLILASIREFGEYMPLVPDLFDVVIIDEASQVSIAQAFPALLRAKKVVVLGDSKQFSNTKSTNASIALNDKYKGDLRAFFTSKISSGTHDLPRLELFDVKRSVLEFVKSCANYEILLRKHFRSYQELISYSSKTFYGGSLQALKVRGCPISDVIRFSLIDATGCKVTRGTNEAEGQFLLDRLYELLDSPKPVTVGVITPFRDQQILLSKLLFSDLRGAEFESKLKLKVMTFDSCQGEERQIIFYSMVATEDQDALNYIFPVKLEAAEENVEEKLKMQRLNVGFSRAQEMIWFLLSKPAGQFKGAISEVIRHYQSILDKRHASAAETDQSSPMEAKVLSWINQTAFYQLHQDRIEVVAQFPIGDYLRQLDPSYQHPAYKCDFLLTFTGESGSVRIIIEYDGFEHHFQKGAEVNVGNHERYMYEADVERQLILESYGYRFLRINRFNLSKDPVDTLSARLYSLTSEVLSETQSEALDDLQKQAAGLASKEMKACSRCKKVKELSEFYDYSLESKYGRVCKSCKGRR